MARGTATARLTGLRELSKVLEKLPKQIGQRVALKALRAGGRVFAKEAASNVPVRSGGGAKLTKKGGSKLRLPGLLKKSIRVVRNRDAEKRRGTSFVVSVGPSREAFYGMFREFGTVHIPKRPWLRPAFDAKAQESTRVIGKTLGKDIEKAAVKLAGPLAKSGLVKRKRRRR